MSVDPSQDETDLAPQSPHPFLTAKEFSAPLTSFWLTRHTPSLINAPRGDGRPIILLPGYLTHDAVMMPLAHYLSSLGYRTYSSGVGINQGNVKKEIERMIYRVQELKRRNRGKPITLIGWSLGGIIARETARRLDKDVREVITLGSPIVGGPKYTSLAGTIGGSRERKLDKMEKRIHLRNLTGLKQPVTSIYSKSDGVVDWRASLDRYNKQARNIEVSGTHFELGVNPRVWRAIADALASSK